MATRSRIAVRNTDGTVDYIYCHWDGYPSYNGKVLTENYADMDRVNALMKLGSLSCLGEELGEKHDFETQVDEWCKAYGRDRGETGTSAKTTTFDKLLSDDSVDYLYLYEDEFWECYRLGTKEKINLYEKN